MSATCVDAVYLLGQGRLASCPDIQTDLLDLYFRHRDVVYCDVCYEIL